MNTSDRKLLKKRAPGATLQARRVPDAFRWYIKQAQWRVVNYGGPVRCSLMKGTMNALFIKIFLLGTAARGYTCLVWYRGFSPIISSKYMWNIFLNNSQVSCNETDTKPVEDRYQKFKLTCKNRKLFNRLNWLMRDYSNLFDEIRYQLLKLVTPFVEIYNKIRTLLYTKIQFFDQRKYRYQRCEFQYWFFNPRRRVIYHRMAWN